MICASVKRLFRIVCSFAIEQTLHQTEGSRGGQVNNDSESTHDLLSQLVATALFQSRIVVVQMHGVIVPALAPSKRAFSTDLVGRLERRKIFSDQFLRDLEIFSALLDDQIEAGTYIGWEADEHCIQGGYETIAHGEGILALARAIREVRLLEGAILAALCAARSVQEAEALLGSCSTVAPHRGATSN